VTTVSEPPTPVAPVPGTVVAAVVTAYVAASLVALTAVAFLVLMLTAGEAILQAFSAGDDLGSVRLALYGTLGAFLGWALLVGVLAAAVLRGRGWARWALAATMLLSIPVGILGYYAVAACFPALAGVTVTVLLLLPSTREWFRQSG
jgi:hypothetical protein